MTYHDRMHLTVNGKATEVSNGSSVADLIRLQNLEGKPCAVEVNRIVVPRRDHSNHDLTEGDVIEIVTLVGGG